MRINRAFLFLPCLVLTLIPLPKVLATTVTVDGNSVKTITEALAKLDRNDGDPDVINVTAPVLEEPGQVAITGKDPISINLDAGRRSAVVVFPKTIEKAGFALKPPMLETPCTYAIKGGILVPRFEVGLGDNGKAAISVEPADGSIGFTANFSNMIVTASGEGSTPVASSQPFSKQNSGWSHGIDLSHLSLNNLTNVAVNLSHSTLTQLNGYSLNLCYANANFGGLKVNVTDSKLIRNNTDNARPMGTWATSGAVVNMTRTELADFKVQLMEALVGERGFEWNLNEGCSIHDFRSQPFLLWSGNIHQNITVNIRGTAANPVLFYNNKDYCFDLGGGQRWAGRRIGFSLNATHAKFLDNAGVLRTNWTPSRFPSPIVTNFTSCEFANNGSQPFSFKQGLLEVAFAKTTFTPDPAVQGANAVAALLKKGTGRLEVRDSLVSAQVPSPKAASVKRSNHVVPVASKTKPSTELVSRSPENQVFQFMTTQSYTPDEARFKPQTATGYLWIPPACPKVRGVLVFGYNAPEHWLVGHPAIREVCAEQNLALLFTSPPCRLFAVCHDGKYSAEDKGKAHVAFLQQIVAALAQESGHEELATAPWLPMGESMSLMIVTHVTNGAPDRCIAGIHIKDGCWGVIKSTDVPMLEACGTAAEWGHPGYDLFNRWREMAVADLEDHIAKATDVPGWPGTLLIEPGSAHFTVTERMCRYFANYIRAAVKARLSPDGSPNLRPVDLNSGYVARLSVPGGTPLSPKPYPECSPEERTLPWYFTKELAQEAFDMANVNWDAKSPDPVFADTQGKPFPFNQAGVADLVFTPEKDGITFALNSTFLDRVPVTALKGRTPLGHPRTNGGRPSIEWVCGPFVPLGNNRFKLLPDRTLGANDRTAGGIFRVIHPGDSEYRLSVNPGLLKVQKNTTGKPQSITFEPIADQPVGTSEVQLRAVSDSGLPVQLYVQAGPAVVQGDKLVLTQVPIGSGPPIPITVVATQFGNAEFQTAVNVTQVFKLSR
jgi:hypothetical protein